jgi:hypothetical protein
MVDSADESDRRTSTSFRPIDDGPTQQHNTYASSILADRYTRRTHAHTMYLNRERWCCSGLYMYCVGVSCQSFVDRLTTEWMGWMDIRQHRSFCERAWDET